MISYENGILTVDDLSAGYGDKQVLKQVSFTLKQGQIGFLTGESGRGKTTLFRALAGYGSLKRSLPDNVRVGVMFQEDRLFDRLTALENVELVLPETVSRKTVSRETSLPPRELLTRLGLGDKLNTPVSELSGGTRRRVALARLLAFDAEINLLDEPTTGLDEGNIALCTDLIREFSLNRIVLIVSHDLSLAEALNAQILSL